MGEEQTGCHSAGNCSSGACEPVNLKFYHRSPFVQNGAKSGFEKCFSPSTQGAGPKHVLNPEYRILRHIVFAGHAQKQQGLTARGTRTH